MRHALVGIPLIATSALLGGCDDKMAVVLGSPALVATAADINALTDAALFAAADPFVPVSGAGAVIAPADAVAAAAAAFGDHFSPSGCASVFATGNTIVFHANNCRGPLGVNFLTGNFTIQYGGGDPPQSTALQINIISNQSKFVSAFGVSSVSMQALALFTQVGLARSLDIHYESKSFGTSTANEFQQDQIGTLSWTQGSRCATQSSMGGLQVNGQDFVQTNTAIQRCFQQCPVSGTAKLEDVAHRTAQVTYDGTTSPPFVVDGSNVGSVFLTCP
jgi:hypothetical protein